MRIAYLCTGNVPACRRTGCALSSASVSKDCYHTLDPRYARNGPTEDPAKDGRFEMLGRDTWWEMDDEAREAQTHAEAPEAIE